MDIEQLRVIAQQASFASLIIGFTTGFLFSFNPVALAAIPVSLAYVTKTHEQKAAVQYAGAFVAGMMIVHVILGAIAGLGGMWVQQLLGRYWGVVLGPVLILLGLAWPGWIRFPLPRIAIRGRRATSMWGAGVLGATFSVAICPFCTPALVVLLGVSATLGSPVFGALLLLAFALGRAIPILLGGWAIGALEELSFLSRHQRAFEVVGGVLLVLAGLYMLNAFFFVIPELAG